MKATRLKSRARRQLRRALVLGPEGEGPKISEGGRGTSSFLSLFRVKERGSRRAEPGQGKETIFGSDHVFLLPPFVKCRGKECGVVTALHGVRKVSSLILGW